MKNFLTRNRRLVEIVLTLLLVALAAGYYYLIYIPDRENQIIERRFRTLQRIEKNMKEKMQGYFSTIKNCVSRGDESFFQDVVNAYNKEPEKFQIKVLQRDTISGAAFYRLNHDSLMGSFIDSLSDFTKFESHSNGRKITITYGLSRLKKDTIIKTTVAALLNYKEFITPLLRKNVFDHYLVFNVSDTNEKASSNIVYEDFASGISFNDIDSLFDAKEKVYTSRIVRIETGGEKYLAFLHPCGHNRKNDRIIAGLFREETFNKKKQQLPERMVTAILFLALFTFLLLPVIRLVLMGGKERIRLFDLFASYLSFLLLIPVLILIFFWNRTRFIPDNPRQQSPKETLANQLSGSLVSDIDSAYALLNKMDTLHTYDPVLKKIDTFNIRYLGHPKGKNPTVHDLSDTRNDNKKSLVAAVRRLDTLLSSDTNRNTQFVFWMNADNGREIANWSFGEDPPRGRYNDRNYYKNANSSNDLVFLNNNYAGFAIEPVVSRIDGNFKFVIARRSFADSLIVASASRLSSVMNPVLPMGYGFSIIDASGNAIFDCDTTHNLNENLLEEFTNPDPLQTVLNTKVSREFTTRYEDNEYEVLAQPIVHLPYFIVVAEDKSFESALNTQCFSFTVVMLFSYFLFLCIELGIVLICHTRRTKLLKSTLELSWAYPHKSMSGKYFFIFAFNTGMLILLGLFCFIGFSVHRITEYIFLFALTALISALAACIAPARATGNHANKALVKNNTWTKISLTILTGAIWLISALYSGWLFLEIALFAMLLVGLFIILRKIARQPKEANNVFSYRKNFRLMVFSKILLTSGIPVIIFYMCIYNFELRLQQRLKLLEYAKKIEQRSKNSGATLADIVQVNDTGRIKPFYADSFWIYKAETVNPSLLRTNPEYTSVEETAIALLKTSRVHYNDVSSATEGLELVKPYDPAKYTFSSIFSDSVMLTYGITTAVNKRMITSAVRISSAPIQYWGNPYSSQRDYIFLLLLFVALFLCYQLLKYVTGKIFGPAIPDAQAFRIKQENLIRDDGAKCLFVHGVPGIDKVAFVKKCLQSNESDTVESSKVAVLDFNKIPPETDISQARENAWYNATDDWRNDIAVLDDKKTKCIIFGHLEYDLHNERANKIKLQLIEKILFKGEKRIIITSAISHIEFIGTFKKAGIIAEGKPDISKKVTSEREEQQKECNSNQYAYRWSNLFGRFVTLCVAAVQENNADMDKSEEAILETQNLYEQSYREIWQSLSHEEQLIMYDLAEDGLANTKNYFPLFNLMNKGLIIETDGILLIKSRSFRNFILTVINAGEMKSIEREINHGQSWDNYKYPVLIVLGALVYLVLSSNPEKFGNVLPLISGIMAGVPTIVKLLSYLKPEPKD